MGKSRRSQNSDNFRISADAPLANLGDYIWRATHPDPDTDTDPDRVRTGRIGDGVPLLRRHRSNRILLYNGCFNPPHRGHLAHLQHAFRYAGEDLGVVAAIVLVADDTYVRWKLWGQSKNKNTNSSSSDALLLPVSQRIRLWEDGLADAGEPARWCWVLPENDWLRVSGKLELLFQRDKFDVEFVRLAGGDKASVQWVQHGAWGCRTTVTTDVSRPVDFYQDDSTSPVLLPNHTPWVKKCSSKETLDRHRTVETTPNQPATPVGRRDVWECERAGRAQRRNILRFISSAKDERLDPDLSSTKLRSIIADCADHPLQELEDELRAIALSPCLLAEFIIEKDKQERRAKPRS